MEIIHKMCQNRTSNSAVSPNFVTKPYFNTEIKYYDDGKIHKISVFKDGKKYMTTLLDENDNKYSEVVYGEDGEIDDGYFFNTGIILERFYHKNGNLSRHNEYSHRKKHGKWYEWDIDGNLMHMDTFDNNKLHGTCTGYHKNGQPLFESQWVNDVKIEPTIFYNEDGTMWCDGPNNNIVDYRPMKRQRV